MKGVPFVGKMCPKGVTFSWKMVYTKVRGWNLRCSLPVQTFVEYPGGGGYLTTPVGVILHLFRFFLPYRSFVKETFGQHNSLLSGVDTFPPGGCTALFSLNKLQVLLNGSWILSNCYNSTFRRPLANHSGIIVIIYIWKSIYYHNYIIS